MFFVNVLRFLIFKMLIEKVNSAMNSRNKIIEKVNSVRI